MELKRCLNLFDATAIGIGAIIGAGIFVVLGIAIGYAGPSVIVSIIIAGVVASFTAFSFAELGSAIPKEGGIYAFAHELFSPAVAFVAGCLWLLAQIVAGVAISLGFAHYFVTVFPVLPINITAALTAAALTGLNIVGIKQSATVNNILVLIKIAILCLFVGFGIFHVNFQNFSSFSPNGAFGVLEGAAFIFFAYLGFGRIATLGEEVKNPQRTLPLSILLALVISIIVYVVTGFTATGLQDYRLLAQSGSPLADAAKAIGNNALVATVSLGAIIATISVLLTNLIGLSRVSFAMARDGQLPKTAAKISSRFGTPYISILIMGAVTASLALVLDLRQTVAVTSFMILSTHVVANLAVVRLRKKMPHSNTFRTPFHPLIPLLGIFSCIILMFSLPMESWIVGTVMVVSTASFYFLRSKWRTKQQLH